MLEALLTSASPCNNPQLDHECTFCEALQPERATHANNSMDDSESLIWLLALHIRL
jgi:hypothetical protein